MDFLEELHSRSLFEYWYHCFNHCFCLHQVHDLNQSKCRKDPQLNLMTATIDGLRFHKFDSVSAKFSVIQIPVMSSRSQSRSNKPNVDPVTEARIKLYKQEIKDAGKEVMVSGMKLRSPHG